MTDSTRTTKTLLSCPILKWSIKTQVDAHIVSLMKEEFNVLRAKYVPDVYDYDMSKDLCIYKSKIWRSKYRKLKKVVEQEGHSCSLWLFIHDINRQWQSYLYSGVFKILFQIIGLLDVFTATTTFDEFNDV